MSNLYYNIAIDLGGTSVRLALFKTRSKDIIIKRAFSTKEFPTKKQLFNKLLDSINSLIWEFSLDRYKIAGIGIGVPGPVDNSKGKIYYFPNIVGWKNVFLKRMLEKKLKLRVCVDNDTNLMALAELKFGLAKTAKNCLCLTLGTGVGGALILNRQLFRGSTSIAGEIGHVPISLNGPKCNCGGKGCLERFVGNKRILSNARNIFGKSITLEELSRLASKGEKKAILIWQDMAEKLGIALSGFINVFNPDLIIIGGGLAGAGDVLFRALRSSVKARAMAPHAKAAKIVKASLGTNAGLIGASVLVDLRKF